MTDKELKKYMTFNSGGQKHIPLFVTDINNSYILSAYQGSFSEYDILIKYRQRSNGKLMLNNSDPTNEKPDDTFFDDLFDVFYINKVNANRINI